MAVAARKKAKQRTVESSVDADEVARFSALAEQWWDANGPLRPLHLLNPVRLGFIRDRAAARFGRDASRPSPLVGLNVVDIGCGGGLVAEPMTRLGAWVVAIDAAADNIGVARRHAEDSGLDIDYRHSSAEDLAAQGARFDIVLALEIIEHVADRDLFLRACGELAAPGGMVVVATLNRTLKAWVLAIAGAEYVLGWLPRGTHDWNKFVRPHEIARGLRASGLKLAEVSGVTYAPLSGEWRLSRDTDVNYMALAVKD
jgi:2-polyprenyl-6-hydroxyphenyl methylase / 3-demethylubiquinone-9 3-methyltransferase